MKYVITFLLMMLGVGLYIASLMPSNVEILILFITVPVYLILICLSQTKDPHGFYWIPWQAPSLLVIFSLSLFTLNLLV